VGSLDNPDLLPPDVHIFTSTKQPWVVIPKGHAAFTGSYETNRVWSEDSLKRRDIYLAALEG